MNFFTLFLILALLIAVWWFVRKRRDAADDAPKTELRRPAANTQFHAVSIKFKGRACAAAKNLSGRRFLASAAPRLPLPDCDILDCTCRFMHHSDRRSSRDRRSPFGPGGLGGGTGAFDTEQRDGIDRRKNED